MLGDGQAVVLQELYAFSGHQRVRVPGAYHHPGDLCRQDRVGTGRLLAPVAAGLQGDIEGAPLRVFCAGGQGAPLGVEIPVPGVIALADDPAVLYQDSAHHWVR